MKEWIPILVLGVLVYAALFGAEQIGFHHGAKQPCQIAIRDHSGYWPRGADGLCHIEDISTSTPN